MSGDTNVRSSASIAFVAGICVALAIAICAISVEFFGSAGPHKAGPLSQLPGFTAEAASEGGLVVTSVKGDSAAAHAGLVAGDHITQVDGRSVSSLSQAEWIVRHHPDGRLEIGLANHGRHRNIVLRPL
ncbi:MAG: PDZ domain-containing protein [Sphingomonas sp.]|nr:PDZ domain-containing protein [Sphingomonas sp.]